MLVGPLPPLEPYLIAAAIELGIAAAPSTIAAKIAQHGRRMERFVEALIAIGLLDAAGAAWRGPTTIAPPPPSGWGRLAEAIVVDRPVDDGEASAHPGYLDVLATWAAAPAAALAEALAARELPSGPIVDLGGGHGVYGATLAARLGRHSVLVDRPAILELVKQLDGRVASQPLDLVAASDWPLPRAAVVLLCNVLHLYDLATGNELVARAARLLKPGGLLVVRELVVDDDRRGPLRSVLFALNMALSTRGGDVRPAATLVTALGAAGLFGLETWPIDGEAESRFFVGRRA